MRLRFIVTSSFLCVVSSCVGSMCVIALCLGSTSALAANPKATALAKDADRFYKDNKYREAAETLKQAYELEPNPLYLYNIARAWDQAGEVEQAMESYRAYTGQAADLTQPELVKKANLAMDRLRTLMAKGEADKKVQDAERKRLEDDRKKAEDRADEESRLAREQRRQYEAKEKAAREAQQVQVNFKKLIAYIVGGVGVACLGTSLVFALLANGSLGSFRKATTLADKLRFEADTKGQALVTDVLLLVGLAATATAVVLYPKGDPGPTGAVSLVSLLVAPMQGGGAFASLGVSF
jgi:tetratricopeptide (TPR) repeat protein